MKKIMFAAVAALAMVGVANALPSYGIRAVCGVELYELDTDPGDGHSYLYSCYVMKQGDAQKAMGTTDTVTYEAMVDWLGKNFVANKKSVTDNAEQIQYFNFDSDAYSFQNGIDDESEGLSTALGIFFYDDGKNRACYVMPNSGDVAFEFNRDPESGWVAVSANVPEPTSGLLLLLGVAGLALKRKRV